ncbi:hypothetical protein CLOP_g23086 [Closterium sp. NIES-67]|nr:hypothetical protein CLOP_g23086 [Closterium sp. NIES-67]
MGKNEFLTPKAIANRIKAKGLQKLRWYCQMCQKQCRDENGFKCHCMSEGHQRQMQVFGMNPERFVGGYSEEFEKTFMEHIRRSHRFSRVAATVAYNEYIADRHHVHMNSTKWLTLTEFVKHLGREGLCKVEDTPKGWFISYIDREPETLFKEGQKKKRERAELVGEERHEKEIQEQIERARSKQPEPDESEEKTVDPEKMALQRDPNAGEKIAFAFGGLGGGGASGSGAQKAGGAPKAGGSNKVEIKAGAAAPMFGEEEDDGDGDGAGGRAPGGKKAKRGGDTGEEAGSRLGAGSAGGAGGAGAGGTLATLMQEQEKAKERANRKDYWLTEGIVVKIMSKALKEKGYYKQKGVVVRVIDRYVGEIKTLDEGHVVRVDQQELESVLPQIGGVVRIVNGAYRGCLAKLVGVDTERFCAKVEIQRGAYDGRVIPRIDYEDICKVHVK